MRLIGSRAIEYAVAHGLKLNKYSDPIEDARTGLSPEEATIIAEEDPRLIWVDSADDLSVGVSYYHSEDDCEYMACSCKRYGWCTPYTGTVEG